MRAGVNQWPHRWDEERPPHHISIFDPDKKYKISFHEQSLRTLVRPRTTAGFGSKIASSVNLMTIHRA
jgi:hypothetical protein